MNTCILCGRLTADPKSGTTQNQKTFCNFTLAVNKAYSKDNGADFIDIVVWGTTATNCAKYLQKGNQVLVAGSITTDTYEKDGVKRKQVRVLANSVEFLSKANSQPTQPKQASIDDLKELEETDEDIPF